MANFANTIIAKSDQLNADDLIGGAITIKITQVAYKESADQPCAIRFEGDQNRPYKPNKTMRKLIIHAWGDEGDNWVGKYMTLWRDPTVKWAGEPVGGIVISHLSDIPQNFELALQVTRGVKKMFKIKKMQQQEKKADPAPPSASQDTAGETAKQEPDGQQKTDSEAQKGDFEVKLSSGEPRRFADPNSMHDFLAANIGSFKDADTIKGFIDRNQENFDLYSRDDQTGTMDKVWTLLKNKEKEFTNVNL